MWAVRIGKLEDSSLIGVRLGTMLAVVVACARLSLTLRYRQNSRMFNGHLFVVHAGQLQAAKLTLTGPKCRTVTVPCEVISPRAAFSAYERLSWLVRG